MSEFHGLDCSCCKDKIPQVQEIIADIHRIMGSMASSPTNDVIQSLSDLSKNTFSGELDDIVSISSAYFKVPMESYYVEQLKLEDYSKTVGKFFVKDLSDAPGLDVTKIIDFSKLDISKFNHLKFSISVPTIEIIKTIKFPFISLGIRFTISRKGFSFFPVLDFGIKNRKQALENLKGVKYSQPLSSTTSLDKAKKIALETYSTSKEVNDIVSTSNNIDDFLTKLSVLGVILFEEIDVDQQLNLFIEKEYQEKTSVEYDTDCKNPGVTPAPFNADELIEIEKDCCNPVIEELIEPEISDENNTELNASYEVDQEAIIDELNIFINGINNVNSVMQSCNSEKQNAIDNYYWYIEAIFLNDIALEYASARILMLDKLRGVFNTLEAEKIRKNDLISSLKAKETNIVVDAYKRLTGATGESATLYTKITSQEFSVIEKDTIFINNLGSIRKDLAKTNVELQQINSDIDNKTKSFDIPEFSDIELNEMKTAISLNDKSIFNTKFQKISDSFSITNNAITNQVGFYSGELQIKLHPLICKEADSIFKINSPAIDELAEYVKKLTKREGLLANKIWNVFYSNNRVDGLFTYKEQGYLSPPPKYNDKGQLIGVNTEIEIENSIDEKIKQLVSKDALTLQIDDKLSSEFWPEIENRTKSKVATLLSDFKRSSEYLNYIKTIKLAAENEAKYAFSITKTFGKSTTTVGVTQESFNEKYKMLYESLSKFRLSLDTKINDLETFIKDKNNCISDQESNIISLSLAYGRKNGTPAIAAPVKTSCKDKLGSDPVGINPMSDCPGIIKNCYWAEYTKMMQKVSLMPIPDDAATGALRKRLFRYYPVAIRIPVPSPTPGVLPTMASGIPDRMISIPMPLVWKHIITITTPIGLFVVWIAICGPIPGPFIMYIDEKLDPCFLITPKGPIVIPARSLKIPANDDIALIDFLPIKNIFKIPMPLFPKLFGTQDIRSSNPDDPLVVIDNIKRKIKAASDSLKAQDPWTSSFKTPKEIAEFKIRANKALRVFPPDMQTVEEAIKNIEISIDKQVDSMKITGIKFPKNPKKLVMPLIGPIEFVDSINSLLDSKTDISSLGLGIPMISLRDKLKILVDRELSSPSVKESFLKINEEIAKLEANIRINESLSFDEKAQRELRAAKLKESVIVPLTAVADSITPEMLGFISMISVPIPLPVPCYDTIVIEPIPPYFLILVTAIKELPDLLNNVSDEKFAAILSKSINLGVPLPRVEDAIYFTIQSMLYFVPDMKFPDPASATMYKQIIKTNIQNFFKLKIRMPHVGAVQITIPPTVIKAAIKSTVKASFGIISGMIMKELVEASKAGDFVKVLAVAAIIKGIFGTELGDISGEDIKAFLTSSLDGIGESLDSVKSMIPNIPSTDFKSIKQSLFPTFPPKLLSLEGPFMEVGTPELLALTTPLLKLLVKAPIPFPVNLLAASQMGSRAVLSKAHPYSAKEILPTWEKMSLKNIPYVIWLDQLIATAQKQAGIGSNYVMPYYLPDA